MSQLLWGHRGQYCPGAEGPQGHCLGAWGVPLPPGSLPLALPPQGEWIRLLPLAQAGGMGSGLEKKHKTKVYFPSALLSPQPWSPSRSPECHEQSFSASLYQLPSPYPIWQWCQAPKWKTPKRQGRSAQVYVCICVDMSVCTHTLLSVWLSRTGARGGQEKGTWREAWCRKGQRDGSDGGAGTGIQSEGEGKNQWDSERQKQRKQASEGGVGCRRREPPGTQGQTAWDVKETQQKVSEGEAGKGGVRSRGNRDGSAVQARVRRTDRSERG